MSLENFGSKTSLDELENNPRQYETSAEKENHFKKKIEKAKEHLNQDYDVYIEHSIGDYRVDVYAEKDDKQIVIEIGKLQNRKAEALKELGYIVKNPDYEHSYEKDEQFSVISQKPYRSGNSTVVTISGIQRLSSTNKIHFKPVDVNGVECILAVPYEQMGVHELQNMNSLLNFTGEQSSTLIRKAKTINGGIKVLEDMTLEEEELLIVKRQI